MKIAKEKVWATVDGKLVADGDPAASELVAAANQSVPDSAVAGYKEADKFFKPAVYDGDGKVEAPKVVAPPKPPTFKMNDDAAPAPENREAELKVKKRTASKKKR